MEQFKLINQRKGQATPGLMLGIGTIMLLFLLIIVFTVNYQIKLQEQEDYIVKRSECLKLANLINSVYINGPGTQIKTNTDFLITTFNTSQISVEDINTINTTDPPIIAFLASEAGPTTYEFYEQVNAALDPDPDWYKVCFSDIGSSASCSGSGTSWMETYIPNNLSQLMDHLYDYNTIYLEDPTIYYTTDYMERLETWTAAGNALILSEHVMCRDTDGSFGSTSYRCDVDNNDNWDVFGVTLHQRGNAYYYPNQYNVLVNNTNEAFDLVVGDRLSFEERPFLTEDDLTDEYEAESLTLANGYSSSTSCECSSPSGGRCARHGGTVGVEGTITQNSFPEDSGEYEVTIRYCDETDDLGHQDSYTLYLDGNPVHTWQSTNGVGSGRIWREETAVININSSDQIRIGGRRGSSSSYARVDKIDFRSTEQPDYEFTTIAVYRNSSNLGDSRNQAAIAFWDYGGGKIFYFGDFLVNYINIPEKEFSDVLVDLISVAYYLVYHPEQDSDITCHFSAFAPYQQVTGDIYIKNQNNFIIIENVEE